MVIKHASLAYHPSLSRIRFEIQLFTQLLFLFIAQTHLRYKPHHFSAEIMFLFSNMNREKDKFQQKNDGKWDI